MRNIPHVIHCDVNIDAIHATCAYRELYTTFLAKLADS